jgi:hypothetical protein
MGSLKKSCHSAILGMLEMVGVITITLPVCATIRLALYHPQLLVQIHEQNGESFLMDIKFICQLVFAGLCESGDVRIMIAWMCGAAMLSFVMTRYDCNAIDERIKAE